VRLHNYQIVAKNFLLERLYTHTGAGLWLGCGLGKSLCTLDAIHTMLSFGEVKRAIVVAPSRVIATSWPKEIKKWGYPLTWSWITGDEEEREEAFQAKPDIYFLGAENLAYRNLSDKSRVKRTQLIDWLLKRKLGADLVVVDEVTKFKNFSASRSKSLRKLIKPIPKRITLTGTPVANSLGDIFNQQLILDKGETLGQFIGAFRERFMRPCGFEDRQWEMRPDSIEPLKRLLAPWYLHQSALDHLDLPKVVHNEIDVVLPPKVLASYKLFVKEMFADFDANPIGTLTAGGRYNLCRQIASGNAYDDDGKAIAVHDAKLDALEDLFDELNGKPLLVGYWYDHEYKRIIERFPHAAVIRGGTSTRKTSEIMAKWKAGELKMLVAQASAISHGVDGLQEACSDLCWYTLTDQPEIRHQFEKRIERQGVRGDYIGIHYLLAVGTLDRTVKRTLDKKDATEQDVLRAVKQLRLEL